jgi:hypothetical protein
LTPPCIAENEIEAGFRAMLGVEGGTAAVGGDSSWARPGIAADNVFIPRPLAELPPLLVEPGAATPATGDVLDKVDEVGLERAPASESDVVGVVTVLDAFAGTTVLDPVEFNDVASFFWVGALSTAAVGAARDVAPLCDDAIPLGCTEALGADFLMSLCDLRIGAGSFEAERVLVVVADVRSETCAFS